MKDFVPFFDPVADFLKAALLFKDPDDACADFLHFFRIPAVDPDGHPGLCESRQISHAARGDHDLTRKRIRLFPDFFNYIFDSRLIERFVRGHKAHIAAVAVRTARRSRSEQGSRARIIHDAGILNPVDGLQQVHDLIHLGVGFLPGQALFGINIDFNIICRHLRQHNDPGAGDVPDAEHKKSYGNRKRYDLHPETEGKRFSVQIEDPAEQPVLLRFYLPQDRARGSRNDCQRHDQRCCQAIGDGQRHRYEELPDSSRREDHRQEHADCRQGRGKDRSHDLPCSLYCRVRCCEPPVPETEYVLHNDNGVVDKHTYPKSEPRQRHHVHGEIAEIHQNDREQDGQRDTDGNHDRRPYIPKEKCQDQDRKQRAEQHALDDAADDQGDIGSLVHEDYRIRPRILFLDLFQCFVAPLGDFIRSGRRAFENAQEDSLLAVQIRVGQTGIIDDRDIRHIGQTNRSDVVHIRKKSLRDRGGIIKFVSDFEKPGIIVLIVNITGRHRKVLRVDHAGQRRCCQQHVEIGIFQCFLAGIIILFLRCAQLCLGVRKLARRYGKRDRSRQLRLRQCAEALLKPCEDGRDLIDIAPEGNDSILNRRDLVIDQLFRFFRRCRNTGGQRNLRRDCRRDAGRDHGRDNRRYN